MIVYQVLYSMLCLLFAGVAKAFLDNSAEGRFKKPFWNKGESFRNKWAQDEYGYLIPYKGKKLWYHLWVFTPAFMERFPLSSTVCVFLTDGWHLFQAIMLFFICLVPAMFFYQHVWQLILVATVAGLLLKGAFVLTRRFILKTNV